MRSDRTALRPIQIENQEIRITDFYIVSAICSAGETPKRIIKENNKIVFIFNNSGVALAIAAAYISNGSYSINLRGFVNSAAEIRNIIRQKMNEFLK